MNQEIVTPEAFLQHWLGHRRLTRRVIEAFPEDRLFTFAAAEKMRPFGELALEIHKGSEMTLDGLLTDEWKEPDWREKVSSKDELLSRWDALTERIRQELPQVSPESYRKPQKLPWDVPLRSGWDNALYNIDNEVHHRGQGYVYLRALGIEPPAFYER